MNTQSPRNHTGPITLSAPLTHSDWMLRSEPEWGAPSVRYMLDQCKASGWTKVYWRVFDGGRAKYASKLADPMGTWDEDNYWNPQHAADRPLAYWTQDPNVDRDKIVEGLARLDYSGFDSLQAAVTYGHGIGLEIHAWVTLNEDDHGWGLQSRFTKANPHSRWVKRDGSVYHSQQSFAFPAVREYKLAVLEELVRGYAIDGLFLDWMRTGDVRDDPQNDAEGVADFGYEAPLVTSFKEQYGLHPLSLPNGDERWVAWRAAPQTEFMRAARRLARGIKPALPIAVMGQHAWSYRGSRHKIDGNLRGLLLDTATWAREGLMDSIVAAGYYRDGGNSEGAYEWLSEQTQGLVDVWLYSWVPDTNEEFDRDLALARKLGAGQVLYWEADYIDAKRDKEALQRHMREAR